MPNSLTIPDEKQGPLASLPDLAAQINNEHRQAEAALNTGLQYARHAGELLLQAKKLCQHGEWLPWLEENFEGSARTAQAYMRVASQLPKLNGKAQRVADLTFRSALAAVASNSQAIAAKPAEEQRAALVAWDKYGCKNAHQALVRAERQRVEKRCATTFTLPAQSEPNLTPHVAPAREYDIEDEARQLDEQLCAYFSEWPDEHRHKVQNVVLRVASLLQEAEPEDDDLPPERIAWQLGSIIKRTITSWRNTHPTVSPNLIALVLREQADQLEKAAQAGEEGGDDE